MKELCDIRSPDIVCKVFCSLTASVFLINVNLVIDEIFGDGEMALTDGGMKSSFIVEGYHCQEIGVCCFRHVLLSLGLEIGVCLYQQLNKFDVPDRRRFVECRLSVPARFRQYPRILVDEILYQVLVTFPGCPMDRR